MRGAWFLLWGVLGLLLSGCLFFSDKPALSRSDAFPGVGKWDCKDFNGKASTMEIKRVRGGYQLDNEPAWFKRLEEGFYLVQLESRDDTLGKIYPYFWIELEGGRLHMSIASPEAIGTAPSKALRAGVELEEVMKEDSPPPLYRVKGEPARILRFLSSFKRSELMTVYSCRKS
ncbi:hypothetical protein [Thermus thermophilus]|uniref:hypothetical protein n=1 Tax=Thermus thermophilus TaxID=274 RepID=UPI001CC3CC35|nr:hypothetical protein [Thermus thermophilus]BDB12596.1 hypothetical protein TthTMY_23350 [Thermus thermophilus]